MARKSSAGIDKIYYIYTVVMQCLQKSLTADEAIEMIRKIIA